MKERHKAGQLATINGKLYQFKKSDAFCKGCALNSITLCPNIADTRFRRKMFRCYHDGLILVKL